MLETYIAPVLSKNPCLRAWDRSPAFKASWSESEASTLFNLVSRVASKKNPAAAAQDVPYLVEMMQRLPYSLVVTPDSWTELLTQVVDSDFARVIYYESLALIGSLPEVTDEHRLILQDLAQSLPLPPPDRLALLTRLYVDAGLRAVEDSLQSSPTTQRGSTVACHPCQTHLVELNLLPESDLVQSVREFLESFESLTLPTEATADIRVAILALVAHAVRADNHIDAKEKLFQEQVTRELGVTDEDVKRYPYLLKSASVAELCSTLKKWAMAHGKPSVLSAAAAYLLEALGSDGIVEIREEKFKTQLMQQLNIDSHQCARLLLRLQMERRA